MPFQWTPECWQTWRESDSPYRRWKSERDRELALRLLGPEPGESILEVGSGYGWITEALLERASIRWVGIDRSEEMVRLLRERLSPFRPVSVIADAHRLPFAADAFDKALCSGVLMHLDDELAALREIVRVVRPGGTVAVSMNNLLSPYSVPVMLHNRRRAGYVQNFHLPGTYRRWLRSLGIDLSPLHGDGLVATVDTSIGPFHFPPRFAYRFLEALDRAAARHLPWLSYEVWLSGIKVA